MFIELVESLRCVEPHDDSWLVLATRRVVGRSVVEGTLGCPVCRRTYVITGGIAFLGAEPDVRGSLMPTAGDAPGAEQPSEEEAMRLGALLDLAAPGGLVVLDGAWSRYADALLAIVRVRLLLVDPPDSVGAGEWLEPDGSVSVLRTSGGVVPLAAGAARAVAIDAGASDARIDGAARVLAAGGRLVAPVNVALPAGTRELARDEALWVAERERGAVGGGAPVSLRRAGRRP